MYSPPKKSYPQSLLAGEVEAVWVVHLTEVGAVATVVLEGVATNKTTISIVL